jgi:mercuric ion transport protein
MRARRLAFAIVAWLFVGAVIAQVFFAGVGLFGAGDMRLHVEFGWGVSYLPILVLLLAWPARVGRQTVLLCVALFVMGSIVQPSLPALGDQLPWVAALHPPNALLVFWIGFVVACRGTAFYRESGSELAQAPEAAGNGGRR